ncbi:MAG TPA: hypothetical protein VGE74_08765 [Gemmata sp.]
MWWHELIAVVAREQGWRDGYWCRVDDGPQFGLFGPRRLAIEVRDGRSSAVLGAFLLDPAQRSVVAARLGPRRFLPVWALRRWVSWLLWMPVWLPARLLLPVVGAWLRALEWFRCWLLRRMDARERERYLASLPPDEREQLAGRCGVESRAPQRRAEPGAPPDTVG